MSFLNRLTGWQITTIAAVALLAPGGLYAAVTFSNVAIVNPASGVPAGVDPGGNLHTRDSLGQYRSDPGNFVNLSIPMTNTSGCEATTYSIPSGKALIITSITGNYFNSGTLTALGLTVSGGATCAGPSYIVQWVAAPKTFGAIVGKSFSYEPGVPIPGGVVSFLSDGDGGYTFVHGYLVPAAMVPASATLGPETKHGPSAAP